MAGSGWIYKLNGKKVEVEASGYRANECTIYNWADDHVGRKWLWEKGQRPEFISYQPGVEPQGNKKRLILTTIRTESPV